MASTIPLPVPAIELLRQRLHPSVLHRAVVLAETFSPADAVAGGWLDRVVDVLEPNAVVVSWWSYSTPLWYGKHIEGRLPGVDIIAFGHVGDGNIHYNITPPPGVDQEAFVEGEGLKLSKAVHDLVSELNGSISAEHGIGRLKREELAWRKAPVEIEMMRAVKKALDPENRMNPGRVL